MLRAIIFDFNGVIADDETPHFLAFQRALAEAGFALTREEYYGTYLGMDERNCLAALLSAPPHPGPLPRGARESSFTLSPRGRGEGEGGLIERILKRKADLFREDTRAHKPELFPGIVDFVKRAGLRYRLAIASGGKREQIDFALKDTPIEKDFSIIVSAEDTTIGKPDPAIYRLMLVRLNASASPAEPEIRPADCLVIEDSLAGIEAATAAGMTVVAVATTYPAARLTGARLVLPGLDGNSLDRMETLFNVEKLPGSRRRPGS